MALSNLLESALHSRLALLDPAHTGALRLFNGFTEGLPGLAADLYGRTLVVFNLADPPAPALPLVEEMAAWFTTRLPWLDCILIKERHAADPARRRGIILSGGQPAAEIVESGVRYALDLQLNQDASLYLDTRSLRRWLLAHSRGWSVLNTFAYTGSLGVAALAGGATRVVQVDRSARFLEMARRSAALNRLDWGRMELRPADFFSEVARLKQQNALFDCVILDPPFFSMTEKGTVNLSAEGTRLINKVRPLVRDGGRIVAVNNALFLGGAEYLASLQMLCDGGYVEIETLLPVNADCTGFGAPTAAYPADPAPFNHPTKIAILLIKRKS